MNTKIGSALLTSVKVATLAIAALSMTIGTADAQPRRGFGPHPGPVYHGGYRGGYHGHGWGPGVFWGGLGIGLGVAAASNYYYNYNYPYGYGYAAPVYVAPPVTVVEPQYVAPSVNQGAPSVDPSSQRSAGSGSAPAPIFYPRNGQSAADTERDRQDCNRWAATQQSALNDANIFQRATLACMEGRGYTVR
jgi:hypothetical protein